MKHIPELPAEAKTPKPLPIFQKTPDGFGDRQIKGFCKTLQSLWAKMDEPASDWFSGAATFAVILVLMAWWGA